MKRTSPRVLIQSLRGFMLSRSPGRFRRDRGVREEDEDQQDQELLVTKIEHHYTPCRPSSIFRNVSSSSPRLAKLYRSRILLRPLTSTIWLCRSLNSPPP